MGRIRQPWQEHFLKRIKIKNEHWIWQGNLNKNGRPTFTKYDPEDDHKCKPGSAIYFAYEFIYGQKPSPSRGVSQICKEKNCVNPHHYTDCNPKDFFENAERDNKIKNLYNNYLKYKAYSMAGIGRKYGISRQRVEQIIKN